MQTVEPPVTEETAAPGPGRVPPRRGVPLGALAGALLLGLYLVVLARPDLDKLPGKWYGPAAVLGLALAGVAAAGARRAGWDAGRVRGWLAAHPALLLISGITAGAAALRLVGI